MGIKLQLLTFLLIFTALAGYTRRYEPLPAEYDGTMMVYDLRDVDTVPFCNDTLRIKGMVQVSRHGARYWSSEKKISELEKILTDFKRSGALSRKGEKLLKLLGQIRNTVSGRWGELSEVGVREENRLGMLATQLYPQLFREGKMEAYSTYVPRVIRTMYEFCYSVARNCEQFNISTSEGHIYDSLLRFFTTDRRYVDFLKEIKHSELLEQYYDSIIPTEPALALLKRTWRNRLSRHELQRLTCMEYAVLQGLRAAGMEAPTTEWMTVPEYRSCWEADNFEHVIMRMSTPVSDLPGLSAVPLLKKIQIDLERMTRGDDSNQKAVCYFGHAETILPLFSQMRLVEAVPENNGENKGVSSYCSSLCDYKLSPLGANLQIILLESDKGNHYITLRLNGRHTTVAGYSETLLPLAVLER